MFFVYQLVVDLTPPLLENSPGLKFDERTIFYILSLSIKSVVDRTVGLISLKLDVVIFFSQLVVHCLIIAHLEFNKDMLGKLRFICRHNLLMDWPIVLFKHIEDTQTQQIGNLLKIVVFRESRIMLHVLTDHLSK